MKVAEHTQPVDMTNLLASGTSRTVLFLLMDFSAGPEANALGREYRKGRVLAGQLS